MALIPKHSWRGIEAKARSMGLVRPIVARTREATCSDPLIREVFRIIRERNLTINDVAEEALGGGDTMYKWAWGKHSPKLKNLRKVLDYLGIDIVLKDK